jgi:tRNA (mo5U34)-methyltransferase
MDACMPAAKTSKTSAALALVDARGLEAAGTQDVCAALRAAATERAQAQVLGDGPRWLAAIAEIERRAPVPWSADPPAPRLGHSRGSEAAVVLEAEAQEAVKQALLELSPWRKGPFDVLGVELDAEWRCDRKWARVEAAVSVAGKTVLDVGCGNGYYLFRALGAGARAALGIDPTWLYVAQFAALRRLIAPLDSSVDFPAWVLPLGLEDLKAPLPRAELVFSMGVLYHRKSPIEHLESLRPLIREGGELVLETLVVPGDANTVLVPTDRYAAMRNVWMIPSVAAVAGWLRRCGYVDIEVVDVTQTTTLEQRATEFMASASLRDFLDPNDPELTIEGYPAPTRAILVCRRK